MTRSFLQFSTPDRDVSRLCEMYSSSSAGRLASRASSLVMRLDCMERMVRFGSSGSPVSEVILFFPSQSYSKATSVSKFSISRN